MKSPNGNTSELLPLLRKLPPFPDEGLHSFLLRLANFNFYQPPQLLEHYIAKQVSMPRDNWDFPNNVTTFEVLHQLTNVPFETLYQLSGHRLAHLVFSPLKTLKTFEFSNGYHATGFFPKETLSHFRSHRKGSWYCAHCLSQVPYYRFAWKLLMLPVCPLHRCFLQQHCPTCEHPLKLGHLLQNECPYCKTPPTQAGATSLPDEPEAAWMPQLVFAWLGLAELPKASLLSLLPEQPPSILYQVAHRLQRVAFVSLMDIGSERKVWELHRLLTKPAQLYQAAKMAIHTLLDWPHRFFAFLDTLQARIHATGVQTRLGNLYYAYLEQQWRHPAFDFIQEAFNHYFSTNYMLSRGGRKSQRFRENIAYKDAHGLMTTAEAAQLLDMPESSIFRNIELGYLHTITIKKMRWLTGESIAAFHEYRANRLTIPQACQFLGTSKTTLIALETRGLLPNRQDSSFRPHFLRSQLRDFLDRLATYLQIPTSSQTLIAWKPNFGYLRDKGYTSVDLFVLVLEGKLTGYVYHLPVESCREIYFELADIRALSPASLQLTRGV